MRKFIFIALGLVLGLSACKPEQDLPTLSQGRADLSRPVFIGGSTLAGYRNGALTRTSQSRSVGAFINQQFLMIDFRFGYGIPLLPDGDGLGVNPKPWESLFQTASQMGDRVDCEGESSLGPVKDTFGLALATNYLTPVYSPDITLMAVPGASFADWRSPRLGYPLTNGNSNPYYARFATNPGTSTLLIDALNYNASFFVATPGLQDLINVATKGMHGISLPDAGTFRNDLDSILSALTSNGAKGALATLPDVGHLPFFTTIPARGLNLDSIQVNDLNPIYSTIGLDDFFVVGENGFVIEDPSAPSGIRQMYADEYLCLTLPLDSVKCNLMGVLFQAIPDQYSLSQTELVSLRAQVASLNQVIRDLAAQYDLAVADLNSYYADVKTGMVVDGVDFTAEFASGNFFSLDGLYPTEKGAALIANQFILAINAQYGATIPTLTLQQFNAVRFP